MRLTNLIPTIAKLVLFKTAILPYLTYSQLVWHFCRASDSLKVERLQERALKAVYKDHYATYSELFMRAQLPTLKNRRLQDVCTLMCKVKHKLCPVYTRYSSRWVPTSNHTKQILIGNFKTQSHVLCTAFFCSQVSKTTWNVLNCYLNLTTDIDCMLQCVCSVVDHICRQSVVRTKKWRSEPCRLNVTFSASCDWSVAIFTSSLKSQES